MMMGAVRKLGAIATVAMTLMAACMAGSASATGSPSVRMAPSAVTTWWVDSTWTSPLTGWVLGEGQPGCPSCAVIRHTDNGGSTWSAVRVPVGRPRVLAASTFACGSPRGCVSHLVFANPEDGFLFGPDLFTTTDGGQIWHRQAGRPTAALQIVAPAVVWRLTYTSDGCPGPCGLTLLEQSVGHSTAWTTVRAPFDGSGTGVTPQIVSTDSDISAFGSTARVLVAFYGNIAGGVTSHATFYVTANLGRSWATRADPCGSTRTAEDDAEDTSTTAASVVVVECLAKATSNSGFILVSHNGGQSFGPRRPIPHPFALMVAAASARTIVVASGNVNGGGPFTYMVETSTNGGASWKTVVRDPETLTSSTPGQSYLAFVTPTVAHWIGFGNKLWTTTDGGAHWTASNV
jgi:hypothetical protein